MILILTKSGNILFYRNAFIKANFIHKKFNIDCFQTIPVFINNLNEPGVRSARYTGDISNSDDNTKLVLNKLRYKK